MEVGSAYPTGIVSKSAARTSAPELDHDVVPNEIELVQHATAVLGAAQVASWMRTEVQSLGGETPYNLMQSVEGRRRVERVLLQIEHGVY